MNAVPKHKWHIFYKRLTVILTIILFIILIITNIAARYQIKLIHETKATAIAEKELTIQKYETTLDILRQQKEIPQSKTEHQIRILRARELAARAMVAQDPTASLNLMLAREAALTTWLTDTNIVTQSFVTKQAQQSLQATIAQAQNLPWRMNLIPTYRERPIQAVVYSPDGQHIAGGSQNALYIWNAATGEIVQTLDGKLGDIVTIAYSPDGKFLASGSRDTQTILLWDTQNWQIIRELAGHTGSIHAIDYNPDGEYIVSGGDDAIRIWNVQTGEQTQQLASPARTVAYHPDGTRIVSGGHHGVVQVWDARSGAELLHLTGHNGPLYAVAYSPDGTQIVSGGGYPTLGQALYVWDAQSGERQHLTSTLRQITTLAYSPDGKLIVTGDGDGTLQVWNAQSVKKLYQLVSHFVPGSVTSIAFSPDGTHLVSGNYSCFTVSNNGTCSAQVWDVHSQVELQQLTIMPSFNFAYSPDGRQIVTNVGDNSVGKCEIHIWNVQTGIETQHLRSPCGPVIYSLDGQYILSGLNIYNIITEQVTHLQNEGDVNYNIRELAYSPDGSRLASGGGDWKEYFGNEKGPPQNISIWDMQSQTHLFQLVGHTNLINAIAYSPDGTQIASSSADQTLRIWDAHSGKELYQLQGDMGQIYALAYHPNGKYLISGGSDGIIRIWDTHNRQEYQQLAGHTGNVTTVEYSYDGKYILSSGEDGTTRIWDAQDGEALYLLTLLSGYVTYNPDSTQIAITNGGIWLWNPEVTRLASADRERVAQCTGHDGWIHVAESLSEGQYILISSDDETKRMFFEDIDYLLKLSQCLIQRNPPIFTNEELDKFSFGE